MAGKLPGPTDNDKLKQLSARTYKEQGVWFLNGYWDEMGASEAENVWKYVHKAQELDLQKGKEGNELDEMMGHRFLEVFSETMTVRELRERLTAKTQERPKFISLAHYLIIKYDLDYKVFVNASQGGNEKELREAQAKLDQVQAALKESEAKASEAAAALREAQRSEAEAKKREAEAKASEAEAKVREAEAKAKEAEAMEREAEARAAQDELEAALAELKAQEDAYNNKKADLERKSEEGGVVSRNKAKAELAQHLAEDPLPLRRAKINQEAAVRKAEKATQIASDARAVASAAADQASSARAQAEKDARDATAARAAAEQAAAESARAAEAAEAALEATRQAFAEAEAYLNEIRSRPGSANGALWWIDRELHEAKAYLPASKGGYSKAK